MHYLQVTQQWHFLSFPLTGEGTGQRLGHQCGDNLLGVGRSFPCWQQGHYIQSQDTRRRWQQCLLWVHGYGNRQRCALESNSSGEIVMERDLYWVVLLLDRVSLWRWSFIHGYRMDRYETQSQILQENVFVWTGSSKIFILNAWRYFLRQGILRCFDAGFSEVVHN